MPASRFVLVSLMVGLAQTTASQITHLGGRHEGEVPSQGGGRHQNASLFAWVDTNADGLVDVAEFARYQEHLTSTGFPPASFRRGVLGAFIRGATLGWDIFEYVEGSQKTLSKDVGGVTIETEDTTPENIATECLLSKAGLAAAGGCIMHMDDSVLWSSYFTNWESQTFSGEPSGSMVLATPVGANNNQAVCIQLQVSWQYGGRVDGVGQSIQNARFRILSSSGFSSSNRDIEITLSTTVGNGANAGNTTYPMALLPLTLQVSQKPTTTQSYIFNLKGDGTHTGTYWQTIDETCSAGTTNSNGNCYVTDCPTWVASQQRTGNIAASLKPTVISLHVLLAAFILFFDCTRT